MGNRRTNPVNDSIKKGLGNGISRRRAAIVRPILKKPGSDLELLSNYRPISLLPVLSKVLEKAVAKHLTAHLEKHNSLAKFHKQWY